MSILIDKVDPKTNRYVKESVKVRTAGAKPDEKTKSAYNPTPAERDCRTDFLKDFRNGWQTMQLPRPEFNDMSLYQRHIIDMLAFNTYQENDGNPMLEDRLGGWKSQAIRPIIRNKAIAMSAHRTARQLVPKVFAYNEEDDAQESDAQVMSYLIDWAREQADYPHMALLRDLQAIYSPISWGYSEYTQVYRTVKDTKGADGVWTTKEILDEDNSGFQHLPISTDQVFFPDFFEKDCQKQDFLILRRIISYDKFKAKYPQSMYPNAQFVQPGIVVVMDDANRGFYNVYDPHMRQFEVEEVIRWRKSTDSKEIMVNGVLLSEPGEANPRMDHQYPFDCFYYLPINERCIAGKSLVFAMQSDANIVNQFYQLLIDFATLNQAPPTITTGSDKVGVDVFVPGLNLAFSDKDVKVEALRTGDGSQLKATADVLDRVEASVAESSQDPIQQGQVPSSTPSTAYEISRIEQNAATVLGLSLKFMLNSHVIPYGKLLVSDILQYMTLADASRVTADEGLVYKTFYAKEPGQVGKTNKIQFDANMPDTMTDDEKMDMSFKLLVQQGGIKSDTVLWKVNPLKFRLFKYTFTVDGDVLNPRSADLTRAADLETYDRAIASPVADQEKIFKDLLMSTNPKTSRDPSAYVAKAPPAAAPGPMGLPDGSTPGGPQQQQVAKPGVIPTSKAKPAMAAH